MQNLIEFFKSSVKIIIIYYSVGTTAAIKKVVSGIRTQVIEAFVASTVSNDGL